MVKPKILLKKLKEKDLGKSKAKMKDKKAIKIAFNILAVFCIILFCMAITPKEYQNDTFYTIKIGQLIRENGIDYQDHFSWNENLPYMYPHWLYDVITSLIYDFLGGFTGIYITTIILSALLGLALYITNKKISKNDLLSFILTLGQMYIMKDYIAARAQLVTFILFVLTIFFIEKYLEKPKIKYALALIVIPIAIANIHSAVFPFYFILYLPYVGEYAIRVLLDWHLPHKIYALYLKMAISRTNKRLKTVNKEKVQIYQNRLSNLNKKVENSDLKFEKFIVKQNDRRKNPYKIKLERNDNTIGLIIIMLICVFTGLLTPIKDMPYTYTYRIMQGNTTSNINEHLPLTLINNKDILISLTIMLGLLIFTKVKIRLRDLFFAGGLTLLALMSRRQVSMLTLFGGLVLSRLISEIVAYYDKNGTEDFMDYMTTLVGEVLTILFIFLISYCLYKPTINAVYVNSSSYPVEASTWIKENLDYKNIKMFNDYNYGSYLLFEDIPVFIDSRCDLYTPEFNGTYNKNNKKYEGKDIFSDYINVSSLSTDYDKKFEEYGITHVMTKTNSKLNMFIAKDSNYKEIYKDSKFIIYERENK